MTRPRPLPDSRIWTIAQVAARLGRSDEWFYRHQARLAQLGFPKKDQALGGWDALAVDAWLDKRAGLDSDESLETQLLAAVQNGENYAAISR